MQKRSLYAKPENGRDGKASNQIDDKAKAASQVFLSDDQVHDVKRRTCV
jgi:hypothetical protein